LVGLVKTGIENLSLTLLREARRRILGRRLLKRIRLTRLAEELGEVSSGVVREV
jgi:hypothetical protein